MDLQKDFDLTSRIIKIFATGLGRTWRFKITGRDADEKLKPVIYAAWHEYILPGACYFKDAGLATIASESRDGRRISSILTRWNYTIVSGSSHRGGMNAIRESVRSLQQGRSLVITVDGPRGPRRKVKKGVSQIALLSQRPVIPVHGVPRRCWRLTSWDRFVIPWPFTRIEMIFDAPLVPEVFRTQDRSVDLFTDTIEHALLSLQQKADP